MAATTFSSSNAFTLKRVPEAVYGVVNSGVAPQFLRFKDFTFNPTIKTEFDKEITADAVQTSATIVSDGGGGDLKCYWLYNEYDALLEAVCRSTFTVFGTSGVGSNFTADITATTITASVATTGANNFANLQRGQWFQLNAPSNPNNKKLFCVSKAVAPTSTVITLDVSTPATPGAAVANLSVATSRLTNGVVMPSDSFETNSTDSGNFFCFTGQVTTKFATAFTSGQLTEATFTTAGRKLPRNNVTAFTGTPVLSTTNQIQNAVKGFQNLWIGGVPGNVSLKTLSFSIDNGAGPQDAIGSLGPVGFRLGTLVPSGSFQMYVSITNSASTVIYDKFEAGFEDSMSFSTQDANGNGYVITLPRIRFVTAKPDAGSRDSDFMITVEYSGLKDVANQTPALQKARFIDRVGSAVTR